MKKQLESLSPVAAPRLVRLGLISLRFVPMGKTLYVVVQVAGWKYSWKLSEETITAVRKMVTADVNRRNQGELLVREGLGYARVGSHGEYQPRLSTLQNQASCHQTK